jgi:hypothetical protein
MRAPAPLRTADWRFVLPIAPDTRFAHLVLLGGSVGVVERALSLGLADRVAAALSQPGSADAVVAYFDAPQPIERIASAVAAGGVLYLEIDRARPGRVSATVRRVTTVLARAGLYVSAIYAVEPDFTVPRALIALRPSALQWYRGTFVRGPTTIATAINAITHPGVWGAERGRGAGVRRFVVVATREPGGAPVPAVLADPALTRCLDPARVAQSAVVLTPGGDRVVMFPFAEHDPTPLAVVKVPKTDGFAGRTENEQGRMRELRSRVSPTLARAIPEPRGVFRLGRLLAACETSLPGQTLWSRAQTRSLALREKIDDLGLAMEWLAAFHLDTEARRVSWREARATYLDEPLHRYGAELGTTREEGLLFTRAREAAGTAEDAELPLVVQHRDFATWNILRDGTTLSVVDWEGACEGPALCDAFHLATSWLHAVRRADSAEEQAACVRSLALESPSDAAAAAARIALTDYARKLRVDPRLQPLLMVYHRVELCLRRQDQRRLQNEMHGGSEPFDEVTILRALAADADGLFTMSDGPA